MIGFDKYIKKSVENSTIIFDINTLWKTTYSPMDRCEKVREMLHLSSLHNISNNEMQCIRTDSDEIDLIMKKW